MPTLKNEPVVIAGLVQTFVAAVLALLIAFGASLTVGQVAAIMGVYTALSAVVLGFIVRKKVTPAP